MGKNGILRDDLADDLADSLNKKFKEHKVAYFLDGDDDSPTNVKEWVSSGCDILDLVVSNRPNAGTFPVGRLVELTGLEQSGKSLLAAHALADTQKKGGLAVFIDTENAASKEFLLAIGVDTVQMLHVELNCLEDIYEAIETIIEKVRTSGSKRQVTIVVDSVAAVKTRGELEGDYDKEGWATDKAIVNSKAMRKITPLIARQNICLVLTNQLRQNLNAGMFGDPYITSGGKAIGFHASVRIRLKRTGHIKKKIEGKELIVGAVTQAEITKNRVGPPRRKVKYDIYFDSGIDNYGSWLPVMKEYGLVTSGGAWYTLKLNEDTEPVKFQSKDFTKLMEENSELRKEVYDMICDKVVLKYKTKDIDAEAIIEEDLEYQDKDDLKKDKAAKEAKKAAKAAATKAKIDEKTEELDVEG